MPDTLSYAESWTCFDFSAYDIMHTSENPKCAWYTLEALVPFFMQDPQSQVCFGL